MMETTVFDLGRVMLCVIVAYGMGVGVLSAIPAWPRAKWIFVFPATVLLFLLPLGPSHEQPGMRAFVALVSIDVMLRLVDVARRIPSGGRSGETGLNFLTPLPVLLVTGEERAAAARLHSPLAAGAAQAIGGAAGFGMCLLTVHALADNPLLASCFALDHIVKVVLFVVTIEAVASMIRGIERLAGFETVPPMNRIYMARTPADFWRRYNIRVHDWLTRNIFIPSGGRHHPVRGVVFVFVVSAFFHEVMFDVTISRIDGGQAIFFLLQIPAVLASPALERWARLHGRAARAATRLSTTVWMTVTAVYFFRGVQAIFPFIYAHP